MRVLICLLLVTCVAFVPLGCGGGGGAPVPNPNPNPDPDPDPDPDPTGDARTKAILEDCLPDAVAELSALNQLGDAMVQGNGSSQGVQLQPDGTGGFLVDGPPDSEFAILMFEHDPSGTGLLEGTGDLTFEDGAGDPLAAFDEAQTNQLRASGIDALGSLLGTLSDGTRLRARYNGAGESATVYDVLVAYASGQPSTATGLFLAQLLTCGVRIEFTDLTWSGLPTAFPTGVFDITLNEDADDVTGTLTMNGTATATASVSRNGGAATSWSINLTTKVATQL